jgi:undecaprenyl-diphosphatase
MLDSSTLAAYIHAGVLGLVQGLTEFLPISSSGHLVVIPKLLGWTDQGVGFDIVLHLATLTAVLIYFRKDLSAVLQGTFTKSYTREAKMGRKLGMELAIATIPVVLVGALLVGYLSDATRNTLVVAGLMIFVGIIYLLVEKISIPRKDLTKLTKLESISIGLAQAAALLPGVSRSGSTIVAGMYNGLKREAAARFSFLLAIPAIFLAGGYSALQVLTGKESFAYPVGVIAVGFIAAVISGLAAINFMMQFVKTHTLNGFAYYLIVFGLGLIGFYYFYGGTLR